MGREQEILEGVIENMARGNETRRKFVVDMKNKKLVPKSINCHDPDKDLVITPEDAKLYSATSEHTAMILVSGEIIEKVTKDGRESRFLFACRDDGDVFNLLSTKSSEDGVPGTIFCVYGEQDPPFLSIGNDSDRVRVVIRPGLKSTVFQPGSIKACGYVKNHQGWQEARVQIVPVRSEIFSRFGGLIETNVISRKKVFVPGLGSGGSYVTSEATKSGVTDFIIMDHDRVEVGNVMRHVARLSDVGRFKTKVLAELIREKNPYANVRTLEKKVSWDNIEEVREFINQAAVVLCCTDNKPSKLILNRLCVEENTPLIIAGAFRRAYGGQVLRIKPGESMCYQCFLMMLPEQANDEEISSREHAQELAYTDRPVDIEPGLSNDIAPISTMVVKLLIQELLKDSNTTLRSLDEDLVAPMYLWLNRRDADTQFANIEPLEYNINTFTILRWYGIDVKRHPGCPVCGNFEKHMAEQIETALPLSK